MSGDVNRDAWAAVVQRILDTECRGNKSAFARRVIIDGRAINPRTVYAWLGGEMAASEKSVRAVAEGFGLNPIDLLVEVGVYSAEHLPRPTREQMNAERQRVLDSGLPDDVQVEILMELDRMEREDAEMLAQLAERDRQRRVERLTTLMEQRRTA